MEFNRERDRLLEKMFDAALKEKMNQLARKYDHDLVFELWTRIVKFGHLKTYFGKWRWKPSMTILEAMECLDDYCVGLETLLQERETSGGGNGRKKKSLRLGKGRSKGQVREEIAGDGPGGDGPGGDGEV